MTKEEAVKEIEKAFEPAFANYIITALTEGATVSDFQRRYGRAYEAGVKDGLEQEPCEDAVSRKSVIAIIQNHWWNCRDIDKLVNELPSVTPQDPIKGHWIDIKNKNGTVIAVRCSKCGNSPKHAIKSDFCPNCGADMREGE